MRSAISRVSTIVFITLVILVLSTFAQPIMLAHAAEFEKECWAVIIGVADYQKLSDLDYADDDARELSQALSPIWSADHINLLLDSQATKANILAAIIWLADKADDDDTVLFFFSGHGGDGYFAPYDASYYWSVTTLISSSELKNKVQSLRSEKIVIIMDICEAELFQNDLTNNGRVIMMACRSNEDSWENDGLQNGVFTYYILQALTKFSDADTNQDCELSAEEVALYAGPMTSQYDGTQHPILDDRYQGELGLLAAFVFATNRPLPIGTQVLVLDGKTYTSVPPQIIWLPGSTHTLEITPLIVTGTGFTRYIFSSWDDGNTSISRTILKGSYMANYDIEHLLRITSAYGEPKGADWYKEGETATFSVTPYVEEPTTKHIFTGWSGDYLGDKPTASVTMNSPKAVTANWRNEYLLTITSPYGEPKGADWYKEGETATISVTSVQGVIIRQVFTGWSGDYLGDKPTASVTMNSPKAVTANWRTDYIRLYILIAGLIVLVAIPIIIIRVRRRRAV